MEAVARSTSSIVAKSYDAKTVSLSTGVMKKSEISFLRSSSDGVRFSHLFSLPLHKNVQSVASSKTEVSPALDTETFGIQTLQPSKTTVLVRFQLQKQCLYGENFLLVGDDPMLGSWNPSDAVPLNWSDGHLWTLQLDIPVEKAIQFKYVLRQANGEIMWQPGPDRIFRAWETNSTIAVTEDWENAEYQKITEEEMTDPNEIDPVFVDNATFLRGGEDEQTANRSEFFITAENGTYQNQGSSVSELDRADTILDWNNSNKWKATLTGKKTTTSVEPEKPVLTYEEGPGLVPGLVPPIMSSNKADAAKGQGMPEITF